MKPWTIKSVSARTQNTITAAARRENLTVGQWVEKRVDEWEASGSPAPVGAPNLTDLAALIAAAGAMAQHTKLPGEVRSLINECARAARGLPSRKPRPTNGGGVARIEAPASAEATEDV
jgi:hypothetical protein